MMRTPKEIQRDILAQRKAEYPLSLSQFSFCVGGNVLTHEVTDEEYQAILESPQGSSTIFGYQLVIK